MEHRQFLSKEWGHMKKKIRTIEIAWLNIGQSPGPTICILVRAMKGIVPHYKRPFPKQWDQKSWKYH